MRLLALAGGGTAGHIVPNLALRDALAAGPWRFVYLGSKGGLEERMAAREGIDFVAVTAGKLRRDSVVRNFSTPVRVVRGVFEAWQGLRRLRPAVVFAAGGYVSVPIVVAARMLGIPTVIHECDLTPGLANRLCAPLVSAITCSFDATLPSLPDRAVWVGAPMRAEIARLAEQRLAMPTTAPSLVVFGGSQGSLHINTVVREALPALLATHRVLHVCGQGRVEPSLVGVAGYEQAEFIDDLPRVLAKASIVVCRAGSNSLWELISLRVPHIAVPLPLSVSRGDQLSNAKYFESKGCTKVLFDDALTATSLVEAVAQVSEHVEQYVAAMQASFPNAVSLDRLVAVIERLAVSEY